MQSIDPDAMSSGKPVNAESLQSVLLTGDFNDMMRRKVHSRENPVCLKSAAQGLVILGTGWRDQQVLCTVCFEL